MAASDLQITSFDSADLKNQFIEFLQSKQEFEDFNYEGSAINTIIDMLVLNDVYIAYMANMLANESFISSAQIRNNVVSHAEKMSYVPRSCTASRAVCDIEVIPSDPSLAELSVSIAAGHPFIGSLGGVAYTFVTNSNYIIYYNVETETYLAEGVELFQGQFLSTVFVYNNVDKRITIPNDRIDTETMTVNVADSNALSIQRTFTRASSINELSSESYVYFLGEDNDGNYYIEFGRGIIGVEPSNNSIVTISYVNTEEIHANGMSVLQSAAAIGPYSDINVTVVDKAWGGSEREDIEDIRFLAPKFYQSQERALSEIDYVSLVKNRFQFIRNVVAWGGEKNEPPVYGTVFLAVLNDDFTKLTTSVKRQIEDFLDEYNVGAIAPSVVDADIINLQLEVEFSIDKTKTNKTFQQLSSDIKNKVSVYGDVEIGNFLKFYNNSQLTCSLMDIVGVESVVINKIAYKTIDVLQFNNPSYVVDFKNPIEMGSLYMSQFFVAINSNDAKLYDKNGEVFVSYKNFQGTEVINKVGTVDYNNGVVEFVMNMIQPEPIVRLYATPAEENFVVDQNTVVVMSEVSTRPLV